MASNDVSISVDAQKLAAVISLIGDLSKASTGLWPLNANQLTVGGGGITATVWTLTVHDPSASNVVTTSVHTTLDAAHRCFFNNYDDENEWDDVQDAAAAQGLNVTIDPHTIALPAVNPSGSGKQLVNVRIGDELLAEVDSYANELGVSRSEAVRQIVRVAMIDKLAGRNEQLRLERIVHES